MRFNGIVLGVNSSPFILNAVLRHHLSSFQANFSSKISQSLYVDDPQFDELVERQNRTLQNILAAYVSWPRFCSVRGVNTEQNLEITQ